MIMSPHHFLAVVARGGPSISDAKQRFISRQSNRCPVPNDSLEQLIYLPAPLSDRDPNSARIEPTTCLVWMKRIENYWTDLPIQVSPSQRAEATALQRYLWIIYTSTRRRHSYHRM